ncbi:hypothetical protein KI387_013157 [Taxus chinensis]|uniref:S5 DRBM domain-containing protein n=1 Tax=Taxus chinensis TaxID=29808 RepID=A0AA38CS13_TAXCH|nr:hypothetical protein KI387_013157 [Taxus chinensis]
MAAGGGGGGGWSRMLLRACRYRYRHDAAHHLFVKRFSTITCKSPRSMNTNIRSYPFSTARLDDIDDMLAELEKQQVRKKREMEEKGEPVEEEEEDYMGLGPIPLEDPPAKEGQEEDDDEDDDYDDFNDDEDDELQALEDREELFEEHFDQYQRLLLSFQNSGNFDEAYKWIDQIDRFEAKHFALSNEYKVVGWLMNRLKEATGKERFMLLMKTQRALKQLEWKENFDPQNPANWGVIKQEGVGPTEDVEQGKQGIESEQIEGQAATDKEDCDLSDEEDKEEIMNEKLHSIDKEIKKKLAQMELSIGKQSRDLEDEIKELVEHRQSLTEKKKQPLYRKGFEAKLIDVNRTCKVTKGGQVHKFSAMVACGNFNGVVGYGKGKGPAVPVALQRAYAKSFQNLHYIERFKEHTIAHAVQAEFKKTKIYLWPGAVNTGMRANRTVESVLYLAGLKNVKSKVIGSRNPQNTVKALFKALNMIETPQDIQEKFGRSVVESYLLK